MSTHEYLVAQIATIQGYPLYWDDAERCPVWPEGEPEAHTFDADGSITVEPLMDVHRIPSYIRQAKPLDCGHLVQGEGFYCTLLASEMDVCLACMQEGGR